MLLAKRLPISEHQLSEKIEHLERQLKRELIEVKEELDEEVCQNSSLLPCKLDILQFLLDSVTRVLIEEKLEHWITFGTLLGAARNRSVVLIKY